MRQYIELAKRVIENGGFLEAKNGESITIGFEVWSDETFRAVPLYPRKDHTIRSSFVSSYYLLRSCNFKDEEGNSVDIGRLLDILTEKSESKRNSFELTDFDGIVFKFNNFGMAFENIEGEIPSIETTLHSPSLDYVLPTILDQLIWMLIILGYFTKITKSWAKSQNYLTGEVKINITGVMNAVNVKVLQKNLDLILSEPFMNVRILPKAHYIDALDFDKHVLVDRDFHKLYNV